MKLSYVAVLAAFVFAIPALAVAETTYQNNDTMNVGTTGGDHNDNNFVNGRGGDDNVVNMDDNDGTKDRHSVYQRPPATADDTSGVKNSGSGKSGRQ